MLIQGTGTNAAPADVLVASNDIEVAYEQSFGVRAEGAISIESIIEISFSGVATRRRGMPGISPARN